MNKLGTRVSKALSNKTTEILRTYVSEHPVLTRLLAAAIATCIVGGPVLVTLRDWYSLVLTFMFAGIVAILLVANPDKEVDHKTPSGIVTQQSSHHFGFLMIGLWLFGSAILLGNRFGDGAFIVWSGDEYWGLLALSATIFALIFGFRISRLWERIGREDERMLALYASAYSYLYRNPTGPLSRHFLLDLQCLDQANLRQQINQQEWYARNRVISNEPRMDEKRPIHKEDVRRNSKKRTLSSLFFHYNRVQHQLTVARTNCLDSMAKQPSEMRQQGEASLKELDGISLDLNTLVHSKQQDREVSELIALVMFAMVTVVLGILSRPPGIITASNGWTPLLMEWFLIIFVTTIAFLAYSMFELRGVRDKPTLVSSRSGSVRKWRESIGDLASFDMDSYRDQEGALWLRSGENAQVQCDLEDYRIFFRYHRELAGDRMKAIALTGTICVVFGILLGFKWL